MKKTQLFKLRECFGSNANLARKLDVSPQTVSNWMTGKMKIPAIHILKMEKLSEGKITLEEFLSREDKCYLKNT